MLKVLACLQYEHDLWLVLGAACVAAIGSLLSLRLFDKALRDRSSRRAPWTLMAGLTGGATIWTTHFVAMLGFDPRVPHGYDPLLTVVSLAVAIVAVSCGLLVICFRTHERLVEVGGALMGFGIVAMHFTGMASFEVAGVMTWDAGYVAASVLFGPVFGALSAHRLVHGGPRTRVIEGTVALLLAICATHFTAMTAVEIAPASGTLAPSGSFVDQSLAILVLAVTVLFLLAGFASFLIDESNKREASDHFRHLALHDALTGLANRTALHHTLTGLIAQGGGTGVAVVAIDLDRFKQINDVHGHPAGDALLSALSRSMTACLRPGETVARTGGDEFVALKAGVAGPGTALDFADRLRHAILQPVAWQGNQLSVGASMGISLYPTDGAGPDDLLSRADLALYRAKDPGSGSIVLYDPQMDEASRARSAFAMELRHAIQRNEFQLYYQPQNDLETRALIGFEVLVRWFHPERGLISPADFIPIAEKTGLIRDIGEWVLRTACKAAAAWSVPYKIAVNVAPSQLVQPGFVEIVLDALLESGLAGARLELEITEASLIADQEQTLAVMHALRRIGVRIAMDDYGTGYASLAVLKTFPFDKIKIDRAFVNCIADDPQAAAIVRSTLILGKALGIPVLAEGVETEEGAAFLQREGCDEVQGFHFGRPMPIGEVNAIIERARTALALPAPRAASLP